MLTFPVSMFATTDCTPAYVTGDRTGSIAVSDSGIANNGIAKAVDGSFTDSTNAWYLDNSAAVVNQWLKFDFGAGVSVKITECKWYQSDTTSHGSWKWQGSNDDSSWSDIGGSFTLGGVATQTHTTLSSNATGYRYYRLLGVSGVSSWVSWQRETEFKQCTL